MAKYGMIIDCGRCLGCYNCFLSCQDEFCGNEYPGYSVAASMDGHDWIRVASKERGSYPRVKVAFFPKTCLQCENCEVMKVARDGAVYRRKDGIIMIDPEKAKGQKQLAEACPYNAVSWNEEQQVAQKCIMCAHMLDAGEIAPRCVEACPTEALVFGDLDDPDSRISKIMAKGTAEIPHADRGLRAKVRYLNRPKRFIGGTVIDQSKQEIVEGVTVNLSAGGETRTMETNGFGDFEFEGLSANVDYVLELIVDGAKAYETTVNTKRDVFLGEIKL